ncbi:DUF4173 domain-containing protein [Solirubrobacter sp. CPCC 204708]|uniref:DUF4173 domain-containing protein n=1 Tax=Solirubrobacter deserti TaxID=2282478 RepID=A0ABT4RKU3_9ACTN|nr:DUF4173 domain-containing protein [Solirubrobacter deserti]MBE2317386.1 DUF4173 domain-containing protein [Solirubrobacter deserti]MDA0139115.1 DUF4173 domain-containing protein [Solirubrobacter deserti]
MSEWIDPPPAHPPTVAVGAEASRPAWSPPSRFVAARDAVPAASARAVIAVAVGAGAIVVGSPLGLGLSLVLLAMGVIVARVKRMAVVPTADLRTRPAPDVRDRWTLVWWTLAAALALVPVLRAATWVVVPCMLVAVAAASLAAADGRRWGELWAGLGAVWARLPLGPVLAVLSAGRGAGFGPAARGAVLTALVLAVFVPLLASADMAFAEILDTVAPGFDLPVTRAFVIAAFVALGGALLYVAVAPYRPQAVAVRRTLGRAEWTLPLGALVALLGGFAALQFATLFAGDRHVLQTAGLTYAEYARSGFAQLLVVAALTLAVVAAAGRWARDGGTLLRVLLAALCLLTLVVLASALKRLGLYEEAYGFTRLRFVAHAILLWLGALFVLVLLARGAQWLPRAALTLTLATFLAFALADPDRRIAQWNVDRFERTGKVDADYLGYLSADAIPALKGMRCVPDVPRSDGLAGLNLGRAQARASGVRSNGC